MTADIDHDDITTDGGTLSEAAAWGGLAIAGIAASATFLATTAWIGRALYGIARDPAARHLAGWPW